jgi:hypothetical protein
MAAGPHNTAGGEIALILREEARGLAYQAMP